MASFHSQSNSPTYGQNGTTAPQSSSHNNYYHQHSQSQAVHPQSSIANSMGGSNGIKHKSSLKGAPISSSSSVCPPHTHSQQGGNKGVSKLVNPPAAAHQHGVVVHQTPEQIHNAKVQSLQDKFNVKLQKYIQLYRQVTSEVVDGAKVRGPLAPYANSVVFDEAKLTEPVCPANNYLFMNKNENYAPWCCPEKPGDQAYKNGVIVGTCTRGTKATQLIKGAAYINSYGYASPISPTYYDKNSATPNYN